MATGMRPSKGKPCLLSSSEIEALAIGLPFLNMKLKDLKEVFKNHKEVLENLAKYDKGELDIDTEPVENILVC